MSISEKRRAQWRRASEHYKEKPDTVRLDLRISKGARENLGQRAQALRMTQKDYLEYILTQDPALFVKRDGDEIQTPQLSTQAALPEEISSLTKFNDKQYLQLSFKELLQVIKKQTFWLDRLQRVNEVLVKRAAPLEKKSGA